MLISFFGLALSLSVTFYLFIYLDMGSHYVAQAGLELEILQPQPPE
jgi:hypothetical protein